jgi:hypothetical protein
MGGTVTVTFRRDFRGTLSGVPASFVLGRAAERLPARSAVRREFPGAARREAAAAFFSGDFLLGFIDVDPHEKTGGIV